MDLKRIKRLRLNMTAHYAVIAWLTAILVANGSGTYFLPLFIFLVSIVAFIVVDYLEIFELKSIAAAVGMVLATSVAIATYVYSVVNESESGQLLAVAGLLVYPEAVLFLQSKNRRIFEQLAVFLLLEMIVAALVNDNILFGILLVPIILLWVSSMFLFSRYATLVRGDPSIETQQPKLAEVLFKRFMRTVLGESKRKPLVVSRFVTDADVQGSNLFRRLVQSIPIGLGALAFAGFFFYLIPRSGTGSFGSAFQNSTVIGLPDRLTFGNVGRILQNPSPVMRVTLKDPLSQEPFKLEAPPYLRARVFDAYGAASTRRGEWKFSGQASNRQLGSRYFNQGSERVRLSDAGRQQVRVDFDLRPEFATEMFGVPPVFPAKDEQQLSLVYDEINMVLQKRDNTGAQPQRSVAYGFVSLGFAKNRQTQVTPARLSYDPASLYQAYRAAIRRLTAGFGRRGGSFEQSNDYRRRLLAEYGIPMDREQSIAAAFAYESHLARSGEFGYTLNIRPPSDGDLDPIEDFIINQKMGHCQYFATAMVCWLRQSGIPSRLVIGYRPTEYNRLGNYFTVRQNDAHAWVEALFSAEDLEGTLLANQRTGNAFYWVRFDPTPPPDGELTITEQDGQAIDYAEKLWKDYVVEGQKLQSENSIYAPVAENKQAYAELVANLQSMGRDLAAGKLGGGDFGIIVPIGIVILLLVAFGVIIWQLVVWLPKIAPNWARRMGIVKNEMQLAHPFYARCLAIVGRLGIKRSQATTPHEYTRRAEDVLSEKGLTAREPLDFLTQLYYRIRFGGKASQLSPAEERMASDKLRLLEQTVADARKEN
ncbi:MAG: DUF3488 and DUF4129 domain-containing transglutaminase family protein [Pirellulaceae bacterium]